MARPSFNDMLGRQGSSNFIQEVERTSQAQSRKNRLFLLLSVLGTITFARLQLYFYGDQRSDILEVIMDRKPSHGSTKLMRDSHAILN